MVEGVASRRAGFRASSVNDLRPAIRAWLGALGVAFLDVKVDAAEQAQIPGK